MDKDILKQYIDACEAVKETEAKTAETSKTAQPAENGTEEAKKAEAEVVLKKLLASGMSADEILEKLK